MEYLTAEETSRLFNVVLRDTSIHCERNRAIFFIAKYCALRVSEVGHIELGDYNPATRALFCRRLKGSSSNTIRIIDPDVIQYFEDYFFLRRSLLDDTPYLFVSQKGTPINRRTLDQIIKQYGKIANIPIHKRHFHILKHTRAMELMERPGIELFDVQWWLGHQSIDNTMLYLTYSTKAQERLYKTLEYFEGDEQYAN